MWEDQENYKLKASGKANWHPGARIGHRRAEQGRRADLTSLENIGPTD